MSNHRKEYNRIYKMYNKTKEYYDKGEQMNKCETCEYNPISRENEKICSICCHNKFNPTFYDNYTPKRSKADKFCDWLFRPEQVLWSPDKYGVIKPKMPRDEVKQALKDAGYEV